MCHIEATLQRLLRLNYEIRMELLLNVQLQDIIKGCKKRDPKYQRMLFQQLYGKAMSICIRYSANKQDAEDIVQEGFIKLFDKIDAFNNVGSFEGWACRIFVNLSLDKIRQQKIHYLTIDEDHDHLGDIDQDDSENELLNTIGKENLIKAIQNLSPMYRTIFNMYVIEGFLHHEIADILDISVGTSKSNLFKAKKKLKKDLEAILRKKYAS